MLKEINIFFKNHLTKIIFLIVLCIVAFFYFHMLKSTRVYGDGKLHALITNEIIKTNGLIDFEPYRVMKILNNEIYLYPITYPEIYHVFLSVGKIFFGESFFQYSSIFLMLTTITVIFSLLVKINIKWAVIASILIATFNIHRFFMSPLMEQLLVTCSVISIYFLFQYFNSKLSIYFLFSCIFSSITASIKQSGWILPIIVFFIFFLKLYLSKSSKKNFSYRQKISKKVKKDLLFGLFITLFVLFAPYFDLIRRNGTVGFVPGDGTFGILQTIPGYNKLFENKFPGDPKATRLNHERIGYSQPKLSFFQVFSDYLIFPINYDRFYNLDSLEIIFIIFLFIFGLIFIINKNKDLLFIFFTTFIIDVFSAYVTRTKIWQYHNIGITVLSIIISAGLIHIFIINNRSSSKFKKNIINCLLAAFSLLVFINPFLKIYKSLYGHSGRQTEENLKAFKLISQYVEKNIEKDEIFITPSMDFRSFSNRYTYWINTGGGSEIIELIGENDISKAVNIMKNKNLKYIIIESEQINRKGLFDYLPKEGLYSHINNNDNFSKKIEINNIALYELNM